jgi:hypothetical protein
MIDPQKFVGLSKRSSQNLAEANSLIYHLVRVDGEAFFPYPTEPRTDRVCIEIEGNQVVKAVIM